MTTTNRLCYTVSKRYIQAGTTFKINVKILLADDCKNNICDWSITADIYEQRKNGRFVWCAGGCCHEEILKRFPQFKMFVDLHLSNHYGAPMYPVESGFYHITNSSKETAINYLRITETEYNLLHQAEDKQYFKYLLYMLGIVERWKEEGKRVNISRFPNFHKSGSIRGMKKQYYGVAALLVRCGSYIYNVTSEPNIYYNAK